MQNEIVLILSLICIYGGVVYFYKTLGRTGLYVWTTIATIAANIEVMLLVDAFGMEQTLGNILFASSFLVTDILSELEGKESASKAVKIGIMTSVTFILITQSWFLYVPNANDWASEPIRSVFSNTPRMMLVGISVYAVAQTFDVWFYHYIWEKTTRKFGDTKKGLWIRNNGSTLVSQLINTCLFTFGAFIGIYDISTLCFITFSSYVIFVGTSLLDTPVIYWIRKTQNVKC